MYLWLFFVKLNAFLKVLNSQPCCHKASGGSAFRTCLCSVSLVISCPVHVFVIVNLALAKVLEVGHSEIRYV